MGKFQELQPRPGEAPSSGWGCCECKSGSGGKALGRNGNQGWDGEWNVLFPSPGGTAVYSDLLC